MSIKIVEMNRTAGIVLYLRKYIDFEFDCNWKCLEININTYIEDVWEEEEDHTKIN